MRASSDSTPGLSNPGFQATHWSMIFLAQQSQVAGASEALNQLCADYWPPLYAFLRREGHSHEDAEDFVQGLFGHLLARKSRFKSVRPAKGRFRTFLIRCLKRRVLNEVKKRKALKRGGGVAHVPLDPHPTDTKGPVVDPPSRDTPERALLRDWADRLLDLVLQRLRTECVVAGKTELYDALQPFLIGDPPKAGYQAVARRLGITEGNARTALHRMRQRYKVILRAEVARTVSGPDQVEDELRALMAALRTT